MKIIHNKLVRDNIPNIIEQDGKYAKTNILNDEDYITCLKTKLMEEAKEVNVAGSKEELIKEIADVLEIIDALKNVYQLDDASIKNEKEHKANKNGKFEKRIFLEYVIEK